MAPLSKITCSSPTSLRNFRSLSRDATILLFTPVILPAGDSKASEERDTIDPFEAFGRALSQHHQRIRHVPFVPKIGYTDTHAAFLSQADAVITVICEPSDEKQASVSHQLDFARATLHATETKEAGASHTLLLVQCASEQYRQAADESFINIVEVPSYDERTAKLLAQTIFSTKR